MKLLEIQSSVRSEGSVSRTLTSKFVYQWQYYHPTAHCHLRDVGQNPPALITADWVTANITPAAQRTDAADALLAESDVLMAELFEADRIVMGAPMYNFSIPANLKAYFDNVIRMGHTVQYDPATGATRGLLMGKKALIISARGGSYAPGTPAAASDFCIPYLRFVLNYLGMEDVTCVEVPYQGSGSEVRQTATQDAIAYLTTLAETW